MAADEVKTEPNAFLLSQQEALLRLAQSESLLGTISAAMREDSPRSIPPPPPERSRPVPPSQPSTATASALPKSVPSACAPSAGATSLETALEKVSHSIDQWSAESRQHYAKLDSLMSERNRILEEGNELQRERLKIEKERLELLKKSAQ